MRKRFWKPWVLQAKQARSRMRNSALVLGYHRIADSFSDPYGLCVRPDMFAEQLEALRTTAQVIDLNTLRKGLRRRSLPKRAVAITFDDGYVDFAEVARPLLECNDLPATVFAVTGDLGQEFWWDRLHRLLFSPSLLPESLELTIREKVYRWSLLEAGPLSVDKRLSGARHRLLQLLYPPIQRLSPDERASALDSLQGWVEGVDRPRPQTSRAMTPDELKVVSNGGLVAVGAHTVSHQPLPTMSATAQKQQISQSKAALTEILERPVTYFSFPHGASCRKSRILVREIGFELAFTSYSDSVSPASDPFNLPRYWIPDWDGEEISRWLHGWFR